MSARPIAVGDRVIDEPEVNRDLVAAERVVAMANMRGAGHLAVVARVAVVVENDLLIKVVQIVEHDGSISVCRRERKQILERTSCDA